RNERPVAGRLQQPDCVIFPSPTEIKPPRSRLCGSAQRGSQFVEINLAFNKNLREYLPHFPNLSLNDIAAKCGDVFSLSAALRNTGSRLGQRSPTCARRLLVSRFRVDEGWIIAHEPLQRVPKAP